MNNLLENLLTVINVFILILLTLFLFYKINKFIRKKIHFYYVRYKLKTGSNHHSKIKLPIYFKQEDVELFIRKDGYEFYKKYKLNCKQESSLGLIDDDYEKEIQTLIITYSYEQKS